MSKRNDEIIISALLSNPSIKAAAEASGVSERVIYSRLNAPAFKSKYDKARRDLLEQSSAAMQQHLAVAISTLGEIVSNQAANPQTRVNAAEAIIKNTLKLTERTDILDRLQKLEEDITIGGDT